MRPAIACHCGQCRRSYSNFAAFSAAQRGDLIVEGEEAITWYVSSPGVRRGFCSLCGSALFWDKADNDFVSVSAGSLDQPSGLTTQCHIYTDDKADFYEIGDGLQRLPQGQEDPWPQSVRGGGPTSGN